MIYTVRFHPAVSRDLRGIAQSMMPHAGPETTARILTQLRNAARSLSQTPHRGSLRNDILPGLRAIPAARRGVIAFTVDDDTREVFVHIIAYGGANWTGRVGGRQAG
ncbi:type II toxin-antitoxin system RelE/ParE family toxin [Tropicibacter sp. S64]|uniref:type II toxin-antitoxin system RelE/ParE family toxin n=1 Tax=Tropicibacter sp. S64 TaxID=3415122 RepID=UPI003C7D1DAE